MRLLRSLFALWLTSCTQDFAQFEPSSDAGPGLDAVSTDTGSGADAALDAGDVNAGLVAYYKFDETNGTSCSDSSGNNHTATLMGGATFASGQGSNAATLSGAGQYVSIPAGIVSGLQAFSMSLWVKLNANVTWTRIFDFGSGTTTYMMLTPNTANATTRFAITVGGNTMEQKVESTPLPTGSWQHVAVTAGQGTAILYVNGNSVAQNPNVTLTPSSLGATTQNCLGRSQFPQDPYLNGQIDNVRIYSRVLTASEVQQLFTQRQ